MPYMRFVVYFIVMLTCLRHCKLVESFKLSRINGRRSKAFISSSGLRRFQSTAVETAPSAVDLGGANKTLSVTSPVSTKDMNLVNLKALVKTLGGTPGSLRKAELLDLCDSLLLQKEADKSSPEPSNEATTEADVSSDVGVVFDTVIAACKAAEPTKQKLRAMAPILPGPQSLDQFQLPVIKGDVNQIGSNIVKDLGDMYATKKSSADEERSSDFDSVGTVQKDDPYAPKKEQIRSYIMGGVHNTSDSMEYLNITSGAHYWAYHPSGIYRDDRIIEGYQRELGLAATGPGSGLGDMDITFLGTASCVPSLTRGVSCVAFRYNSDVWLVDCGEGSQQQMQKSRIKPSKITKIFITHLHGDHSFGIPGVLCLIGQATMAEREKEKVTKGRLDRSDPRRLLEEDTVLDIYGPEGTRDYVRAAIQLTHSKVVHPYRVHELKDVPNLYVRPPKLPPPLPVVHTRFSSQHGERLGGLDIYPDKNGHYMLFDEALVGVQAAPTEHTIPCVSYVITEKKKPGRLKIEEVTEAVNRNKQALAEKFKLRDPNKIFQVLKEMKPGSTLVFPDGTVINADDIIERPRSGRKVVIMGDTCNSDILEPLAVDADILVHEATNAWIRDQDIAKYPTELDLERETYRHGHSTPQMAGRFCKKIKAKKLILTHFSPRYRGDESEYNMRVMWRMEHMSRRVTGLWGKNAVIAAWDQMCIPVRTREDEMEIAEKENAVRKAANTLAEEKEQLEA